jgi:serine/threonine-protein kinase
VALDSSGGVIIADTGRNCVRRAAGASLTHVAGGGATTGCTTASILPAAVSLSGPESVDVDLTGRVIIADTGRRCVWLAAAGTVTPLGFSGANGNAGDGGPAVVASIRTPAGVALRADGSIVVSDRATNNGANRVRLLRAPLP